MLEITGVNVGAEGWDSETMQKYGDKLKNYIAPVHTKDGMQLWPIGFREGCSFPIEL